MKDKPIFTITFYDEDTTATYGTIWVVTYCDKDDKPVVTAFGNIEAAEAYYNYYKLYHDRCYIDELGIYNKFFDGEKWIGPEMI